MYLSLYEVGGIIIVLSVAVCAIIYTIIINTELNRQVEFLRSINRDLRKRLENSVERPF